MKKNSAVTKLEQMRIQGQVEVASFDPAARRLVGVALDRVVVLPLCTLIQAGRHDNRAVGEANDGWIPASVRHGVDRGPGHGVRIEDQHVPDAGKAVPGVFHTAVHDDLVVLSAAAGGQDAAVA